MQIKMNRAEFDALAASVGAFNSQEATTSFNKIVMGKNPNVKVKVSGDEITISVQQKHTVTFLTVLRSHASRIGMLARGGTTIFTLPKWIEEGKTFLEDLKKVF